MRLFEAIIDANHRAVAGDAEASLRPADFADELPIIALTCIDPRLNALFPNVIGLPGEQFIWLRNAGNIITSTLSSTMRSLALACAVKGGREIVIIGHTDCHVAQTTTTVLLDRLKALGVDRSQLPANLSEYFGTFGSERQNVIKGCSFARSSPLIGPKIPVHGLMVDIQTGKLDWVVNGYETLHAPAQPTMAKTDFATMGALGAFKDFDMGEMKFPEMKIGDAAAPGKPAETAARPGMITVPPAATPPPPPIKKSPLPPIKTKPPLNPYKDFRRG
ncbi:MAG TPA: carbonic anhydrase [Candidatus Acidoferrales bacterium]|jgi:carbonic anhydrase|nr:carbonic anhydrase [Candidatus Acidoferrales bacterium]